MPSGVPSLPEVVVNVLGEAPLFVQSGYRGGALRIGRSRRIHTARVRITRPSFSSPDLTLVPFDLRTAPLFGCNLVQGGHKSVIARIHQSLEMPTRIDTG
jgi:hypothetical protein